MMCVDIWHHSGDIKVDMWPQFNPKLAKKFGIRLIAY